MTEFGERFLIFPDLFPARQSGERWGEAELPTVTAGTRFALKGLSTGQLASLSEHYSRAAPTETLDLSSKEQPVVDIRVFRAPESDFLPTSQEGNPAVDIDKSDAAVRVAAPGFMGRIDRRPTLGGALWTPLEGPNPELVSIFESFLRIVSETRSAD